MSPSRLNLWLRCPLAFEFKYLQGIEVATSPSLFLGKTLHALLECYYRHRQLGISVGMAELTSQMDEIWPQALAEERPPLDGPSEEQAVKVQALGLVEAYLGEFAKESARVLAVESVMEAPLVHPETGRDFGIPLVGITDLVLETDAGPVIVDFFCGLQRS